MFCKNCGKELADGVKFCPECGTNQKESTESPLESKLDKINSLCISRRLSCFL